MQKIVTMVFIVLLSLGSGIGSMAFAGVTEGRALLFNQGNPSLKGIAAAKAKFQEAYTANPADSAAALFLAVTKLAVFGMENGDNPIVIQTFRDLYEAFGLSLLDVENMSEQLISEPPTVFNEYNPPETIPNGDELQIFLAGPFLGLIDELIGYVDGVKDQKFTVVLTRDELGSSTGLKIDYGDMLVFRSFFVHVQGPCPVREFL